MKVRATDKYEKLNVKDKILSRVPKTGEVFEVSDERFKVLSGNNEYNEVFVEKYIEELEIATVKPKIEKAVKKTINKTK